jgi:hypothetical protein
MKKVFLIGFLLSAVLVQSAHSPDWGFFGHRRINRLATFTLPPEMIGFFKKNIEYITQHAVDPDKRRYATRHEAVRHYIDIDHWGSYPFPEVPRNWTDVLAQYTEVRMVTSRGDTLSLTGNDRSKLEDGRWWYTEGLLHDLAISVDQAAYRGFIRNSIIPTYYEEEWPVSCDSLQALFGIAADQWDCQFADAIDHFSEYGILPYHLVKVQRQLTDAFVAGDPDRILRICADFGHYIGDAHVPLHTTENYNGQLTGQDGIHAFWESRIPELFADDTYDFFVGKATYIEDPSSYYWNIVLESHLLVDSVLGVELDLRRTFPEDQQYCYDERLGVTIRTQCPEFAAAYQARLQGSIQERMRASIQSVGSAWYTAWVDAGSPPLDFGRVAEEVEEDNSRPPGEPLGRRHDN